MAIAALVNLKFNPQLPPAKCRAELRKIANVIQRRPRGRGAKLPPGDWLEAELRGLVELIDTNNLLAFKKDRSLREKVMAALSPPPIPPIEVEHEGRRELIPMDDSIPLNPAQKERICKGLLEGVRRGQAYVRRPRSWALQALAAMYRVDPKIIEKRIRRDKQSGSRKR